MVEEWLFLWTEIPGETVSNWSASFHLQLKSICILNIKTNISQKSWDVLNCIAPLSF